MPEGDTIHRTAQRLAPALVGQVVRRFEAPRMLGTSPRAGELIESLEAVGKHLLVRFSGGLTLETHMRMTGSWHLYRRGERWRKGAHLRRCVIETDEWIAVCFSAPVVRTFPTAAEGTGTDPLGHLGPDLCDPGADDPSVVERCVERMAALAEPSAEIGVALLDQRIANGVGNVFRSEICWSCGVDPRVARRFGRRRYPTSLDRNRRPAVASQPRRSVALHRVRWRTGGLRTAGPTLPPVRDEDHVGPLR